MNDIKDSFFSTLVFLTRFPVKIKFNYISKSDNMIFFPIIGLILGVCTLVLVHFSNMIFGAHIAAILGVLSLVIMTGGLHLDGLSDSFDGLFSYRDKDKIIEIMKDSRIGAMGVLAVVFLLILKIAFFEFCITSNNIFILMFVPVIGRLSLIIICYKARPLNKSKMGEPFIGKLSKFKYYAIIIFYGILMVTAIGLIYGKIFALSLGLSFLSIFYLVKKIRNFVYSKIDGISGDILGATCEIVEMLVIPIIYVGVYICKLFI